MFDLPCDDSSIMIPRCVVHTGRSSVVVAAQQETGPLMHGGSKCDCAAFIPLAQQRAHRSACPIRARTQHECTWSRRAFASLIYEPSSYPWPAVFPRRLLLLCVDAMVVPILFSQSEERLRSDPVMSHPQKNCSKLTCVFKLQKATQQHNTARRCRRRVISVRHTSLPTREEARTAA